MKAFYTDQFVLPLPPEHRFPMAKYRLLRERVEAVRSEIGAELTVPDAATFEQLVTVHDTAYVDRVFSGGLAAAEVRRIGFPWSPELVERSRRSVGGTLGAARAALNDGVAVNLAGGTHHAFPGHGEGFCVFNDVAVSVRVLQAEGCFTRALIVDCDVHQGNGTAAVFVEDDSVFTFSIHGAKNYPLRKQESDLDVALADGTADDEYLDRLTTALRSSVRRSQPEIVFYVAGADAYREDRLGRLALSRAGLAARDRQVLDAARRCGAAVVGVMAGGYCPEVEAIVEIHLNTVRACAAVTSDLNGALQRKVSRTPDGARLENDSRGVS